MKAFFSLLLAAALCLGGMALARQDDTVYGLMNIPYADFYAQEGVSIPVDGVSSATNGKWKNENLVAGTYCAAHEADEGGDILGVTFPVAISQADLTALGEDNYGFTALDAAPAAFKTAALTDGILTFSALNGEESSFEAAVTLTTESRYGDYQITVDAIHNADGVSDIGAIYGVLLSTGDKVYALRHLENIWRDSLAFTSGFKTTEGHGNALNPENYAEMMGQTITSIIYLTDTGRHTLPCSLYVPVKFDGSAAVADAAAKDGQTTLTLTGLPADYAPAYQVHGLDVTVTDGTVSFTDALPTAYTLTVSDETGVYADLLAPFTLTTDILPAAFDADAKAIVAAADADPALFSAFVAQIASVTVNDTTYPASGRGAVAIIDTDGVVDTEAVVTQGRGPDAAASPVFPETGDYTLTVTSTGFTAPLTFTLTIAE